MISGGYLSVISRRFLSWPRTDYSPVISSTCSSFWLTTYLFSLVDVSFNIQSAYLWVQTVLLFSPTCSFIRMRETSYWDFSRKTKRLARSFNFTFRYIDDVLSLNNSRLGDFVDRIYLIELEIKDTTDIDRSAWYLDLHLEIDSDGRLRTKLYDNRDDFNLPLVKNFHWYVATFQQHLHMEYISLSWYDIPEIVVPIRISLIKGCC